MSVVQSDIQLITNNIKFHYLLSHLLPHTLGAGIFITSLLTLVNFASHIREVKLER